MKAVILPSGYNPKNASATDRAANSGWRQRWARRLNALALWVANDDFYRERQRVLQTTATYHDAVLGLAVARNALKAATQRNKTAKQALAEQLAGKRAARKQRRSSPTADVVQVGEVYERRHTPIDIAAIVDKEGAI